MLLNIADNGHITLTIRDNNDEQTYEFESRADFKQQQPELYEKYNDLLEEAQSGARIEYSRVRRGVNQYHPRPNSAYQPA